MRKRKRSAGSGASALMGGIATNKITTFLVEAEAEARKRKRGSGSGTKFLKSASLVGGPVEVISFSAFQFFALFPLKNEV